MVDPQSVEFDPWVVAKILWGILVSLLSFMGLRQITRVDKLSENKVNKDDLASVVDRIDADIAARHKDNQDAIDDLKRDARTNREENRQEHSTMNQLLIDILKRLPPK